MTKSQNLHWAIRRTYAKRINVMKLRPHQAQCLERAQALCDGSLEADCTRLYGAPGTGKTTCASVFAKAVIHGSYVTQVLYVAPRTSLLTQLREALDIPSRTIGSGGLTEQERRKLKKLGLPSSTRIVRTTYQQIVSDINPLLRFLEAGPTLLIFDEAHHLPDLPDADWTRCASRLVEHPNCRHTLSMSGWPARTRESERLPPWVIEYQRNSDGTETIVADIQYTRAQAISDGAVLPVRFYHEDPEGITFQDYDGNSTFLPNMGPDTKKKERAIARRAYLERHFTRLIQNALAVWEREKELFPHAQLLVIANSQSHARAIHKWLSQNADAEIALAISDEGSSADERIEVFRKRQLFDILVTCEKAYEGLDAECVSVVAYLSAKRTFSHFLQSISRACRHAPTFDPARAKRWGHIVAPGDAEMVDLIRNLQRDQIKLLASSKADNTRTPQRSGRPRPEIPLLTYERIMSSERDELAGFLEPGIAPPALMAELRSMQKKVPVFARCSLSERLQALKAMNPAFLKELLLEKLA